MQVLLDLTAPSDRVDHAVLVFRQEQHVGIQGTILQWFMSHLANKSSAVVTSGATGFHVGLILFSSYVSFVISMQMYRYS